MDPIEFTGTRGFLPEHDPLERLPPLFDAWEEFAKNLPKELLSDRVIEKVLTLPPFPVEEIHTAQELNRAMQLISYLGHAYVWFQKIPPKILPKQLAFPWYRIAKQLDRPPVLSYDSYALQNWKRHDRNLGIELGNIKLIQNFLGGVDEEWFVLVHVAIENAAIGAWQNTMKAIKAAQEKKIDALNTSLQAIEQSLQKMCAILKRMPERCDPYIYYTRVRPYIHGWKGHPSFPDGLIYEGVEEYKNIPQKFRGETGAQSAIIPMLDNLLGIVHEQDELYTYLQEMRLYMPLQHRRFLLYVQEGNIRDFVCANPPIKEVYNRCIDLINFFRTIHLSYAVAYVQKQHEKSEKNPTAVGTGGTPFMPYLQKHKEETEKFKL